MACAHVCANGAITRVMTSKANKIKQKKAPLQCAQLSKTTGKIVPSWIFLTLITFGLWPHTTWYGGGCSRDDFSCASSGRPTIQAAVSIGSVCSISGIYPCKRPPHAQSARNCWTARSDRNNRSQSYRLESTVSSHGPFTSKYFSDFTKGTSILVFRLILTFLGENSSALSSVAGRLKVE